MGIEPTYPAWKAGVLPLNYTRIFAETVKVVYSIGVTGFEPAASRPPAVRSNQTEPHPDNVFIIQNEGKNVNTFSFYICIMKIHKL